ncbi:MAG TPA: hypothetical protein RMG48_16820 [Myxococcales bacterium LLY-WYZ-16_1]|nr:hypothetical protein [Myxococcales bacterium LLY-WYZ-16_1]
MTEQRGPIDDGPWPDHMTTRVCSPGSAPRIHGYGVDDDLAVHYGATERLYLAWTGQLPEGPQARLLDTSLGFASAIHAGDGPTWAAITARLAGGHDGAWMSTGSIVLLEEGEAWSRRLSPLAELSPWAHGPLSPEAREAVRPDDAPSGERALAFVAALEQAGLRSFASEGAPEGWGLEALLVWTWCGLGFRRPRLWTALWFQARWPVLVAEAARMKPSAFRTYPMNLPPFAYEDPNRDGA